MDEANVVPCSSCSAPIRWIVNHKGNRTPVDAKPKKRYVLKGSDGWRLVDAYTTHFETCPSAQQHRKKL